MHLTNIWASSSKTNLAEIIEFMELVQFRLAEVLAHFILLLFYNFWLLILFCPAHPSPSCVVYMILNAAENYIFTNMVKKLAGSLNSAWVMFWLC